MNPVAAGRLDDAAGVILAGGRSRRMQGVPKALLALAGKPMLQHVIDRLAPQVSDLFLGVEAHSGTFDSFGLAQVPDPEPGSNGPLGGLAAALGRSVELGRQWLVLAPCDAPFLPPDLAARLHRSAVSGEARIAVAQDEKVLQPAFSLWHVDLLPEVRQAVAAGRAGFKQFLRGRRFASVEWPEDAGHPFFNVNDRDALQRAQRLAAELKGQER